MSYWFHFIDKKAVNQRENYCDKLCNQSKLCSCRLLSALRQEDGLYCTILPSTSRTPLVIQLSFSAQDNSQCPVFNFLQLQLWNSVPFNSFQHSQYSLHFLGKKVKKKLPDYTLWCIKLQSTIETIYSAKHRAAGKSPALSSPGSLSHADAMF